MTSTQSTAVINQPTGSSGGIRQQQSPLFPQALRFQWCRQRPLLAIGAWTERDNMDTLGNAKDLLAGHLRSASLPSPGWTAEVFVGQMPKMQKDACESGACGMDTAGPGSCSHARIKGGWLWGQDGEGCC